MRCGCTISAWNARDKAWSENILVSHGNRSSKVSPQYLKKKNLADLGYEGANFGTLSRKRTNC
jgi:hypothetical protein